MSREPDAEEMLEFALQWLQNVAVSDRGLYLNAMPNNCLGVPAMQTRLGEIRRRRAEEGL